MNLLIAAAKFNHLRALADLAAIYREGKLVPKDEVKANHYARKAFLRQVILYPDKPWQIIDLPIPGYAERLVARTQERIYHEMLCLLNPEFDFLFSKKSSMVPLVHTPTSRGIVENLKTIVPYFIEQMLYFDKEELKSPRLKRALANLLQHYQLPKMQRDQIHLLLAYQHSVENNPSTAAQHVMAIKQPHVYIEVIRALDPEGKIGRILLTFTQQPESQSFDEANALLDYALVYLIACIPTLDNIYHYKLQHYLSERFSEELQTPLLPDQLVAWHLQYCQVRYALYKIQRFIEVSSRGWHFRHHQQKMATQAWQRILEQLILQQPLSTDNLESIKSAYPLLSQSIDLLRNANPLVLKRTSQIAELLKTKE